MGFMGLRRPNAAGSGSISVQGPNAIDTEAAVSFSRGLWGGVLAGSSWNYVRVLNRRAISRPVCNRLLGSRLGEAEVSRPFALDPITFLVKEVASRYLRYQHTRMVFG